MPWTLPVGLWTWAVVISLGVSSAIREQIQETNYKWSVITLVFGNFVPYLLWIRIPCEEIFLWEPFALTQNQWRNLQSPNILSVYFFLKFVLSPALQPSPAQPLTASFTGDYLMGPYGCFGRHGFMHKCSYVLTVRKRTHYRVFIATFLPKAIVGLCRISFLKNLNEW